MGKVTMIHFKTVKKGSEAHNKREKELNYVRHDLPHEYWQEDTQANILEADKASVKEKTGRSMQKRATPIQEAVVLIKQDTNMSDLKHLAEEIEKKYGIHCFQIGIHKDEGRYDKNTHEWIPNLHAHMVFNWIRSDGKSFRPSRRQLSDMQDLPAAVLGMQRGVSSNVKHLDAIQYKNAQEALRAEKIAADVEFINTRRESAQKQCNAAIERKEQLDNEIEDTQKKLDMIENFDYSSAIYNLSNKIVLGEGHRWQTTGGRWHQTTKEDVRKDFDRIASGDGQWNFQDATDERLHRQTLAKSLEIHCLSRLSASQLENVTDMLNEFATHTPVTDAYEARERQRDGLNDKNHIDGGFRPHMRL